MKIEYISQDEFELSYRAEIYEESEALIQDHLWWNEPFTLYDKIEFPLYLTGESDLIRDTLDGDFGPRRFIERKDDVFLALVDYAKIVGVLRQLSESHEITWRVFYRSEPRREVDIGYIVNGKADGSVIDFMIKTLEQYELSHESVWDEALKDQVYSKYFDELDQPIFEDESHYNDDLS